MIGFRTLIFLSLFSSYIMGISLYAEDPPIGVYNAITESEWTQEVTLRKNGEAEILSESWEPGEHNKLEQKKVKCAWEGKLDKISLRCNDELLILKFEAKLSALDLTGPPEECGPALVVVSSTKSGNLSILQAKQFWREDFGTRIIERMYNPEKKEVTGSDQK